MILIHHRTLYGTSSIKLIYIYKIKGKKERKNQPPTHKHTRILSHSGKNEKCSVINDTANFFTKSSAQHVMTLEVFQNHHLERLN